MKRITAMIMTLQVVFGHVMADERKSVHEVNQLLTKVTNWQEAECGVDVYYFAFDCWDKTLEFTQLNEIVSKDWKVILNNLEKIIAPSDMHQIILCRAFSTLPQKYAFQCLNKIIDLYLKNIIDAEVFDLSMNFYEEHIKNIEQLDYKDILVGNVYEKLKLIYADNSEAAKHLDEILSRTDYRKSMGLSEDAAFATTKGKILFYDAIFVIIIAIPIIIIVVVCRKIRRRSSQ